MVKRNYIFPTLIWLVLIFLMQLTSEYARNHGLAATNSFFLFGKIFTNAIAVVISTSVVVIAVFFLFISKMRPDFWIVLLTAGAISNISDRLRFGGVIDYFSLPNFYIFNLADLAIILGLIGLLAKLAFSKK